MEALEGMEVQSGGAGDMEESRQRDGGGMEGPGGGVEVKNGETFLLPPSSTEPT